MRSELFGLSGLFGLAALAGVVLSAALFAACGPERGSSSSPPSSSPTDSARTGSERVAGVVALLDTVSARARRGDTPGLLRVQVDDVTYRAHVWPLSATYEPAREEVWDFVIGLHKANSSKGLRRLLSDIDAPHPVEIESPEFAVVEIPGGTLHMAAKRDRARDGSVRLFGSALCLESGCQVVSYNQGGSGKRLDESGASHIPGDAE